MAYTRTTVIDASPSGDSVKQAVLDLDADLTGAFDGINQLQAALALKINQSEYDQPNGIPRLDSSGMIKASQLPGTLADSPVGLIAAFGLESLPADCNWLECNGAELPIADYQGLYAAMGNAFGLAASPANFKLPDLRGEFLRGWDHGRGRDPNAQIRDRGDRVGSTQDEAFKAHTHQIPGYHASLSSLFGGNERILDVGDFPNGTLASGGSETRPVNTAVLYAIKWR